MSSAEDEEYPDDHPIGIVLNRICGEYSVRNALYSEETLAKQRKLIDMMEAGFKKYNITMADVIIDEIVPIFFAMLSFAHPIIIKYMKDSLNIGEYYTHNGRTYYVKAEVKEILELQYIRIYYKCVRSVLPFEDFQQIIDEYAEMFGVDYEKKNYD